MYEYFDERNYVYLSHYGRNGMKWYQHIFGEYNGAAKYAARRRNGLVDRVKQLRANRLKKIESKRVAEEKARQTSLDDIKKKAITNGDIDTILKMKGQMSTQELQEAAKRLLAIKQIDQYRLPKEKTTLDKLVSRLDTGAKTINSVKNFAKSITDLRDQLSGKSSDNKSNQNQNAQQGKKKKNKGSIQDGDQNQNQSNNKDSDSFDKLANAIAKKLSDVPDNKSQSNQNQNQPKEKKPKGLDLFENEPSDWTPPTSSRRTSLVDIPKASLDSRSLANRLSKVGKIFSDSDSSSYSKVTEKPFSNSNSNLMKAARETALSEIENRNKRGWTASNNDDWLRVLSNASTVAITEGENIWEERYSKK